MTFSLSVQLVDVVEDLGRTADRTVDLGRTVQVVMIALPLYLKPGVDKSSDVSNDGTGLVSGIP